MNKTWWSKDSCRDKVIMKKSQVEKKKKKTESKEIKVITSAKLSKSY